MLRLPHSLPYALTKLIYHSPSSSCITSPFDEAILRVAKDGALKIVSPFVGVSYLERVIGVSNQWELISDIEAWLSSLSCRARPRAWGFIRANLDRIHHCAAIHAKTVIGESLALLGSANLTNTGILARDEMGVLLDDPTLIEELHSWFDQLWQQTAPPVLDETSAYIQWLDQEAQAIASRSKPDALSTPGQRVRTRLATIPRVMQAPIEKPLDLALVAEGLVGTEVRAYDDVAAAIESSLKATGTGLTLRKLIEHTRNSQSLSRTRDLYLALLAFCANHPRTVFSPSTINRMIFQDGQFVHSTATALDLALKPFDAYLAVLIHHLDFDHPRMLPDASQLTHLSAVSPRHYPNLVRSLLSIGLLNYDATAGGYLLSEDFEWPPRYRLFKRATAQWDERLGTYATAQSSGSKLSSPLVLAGSSDPTAYQHIEPRKTAESTSPVLSISTRTNVPDNQADTERASTEKELVSARIRDNAAVADKIYWALLVKVAKQGPALGYISVENLAKSLKPMLTKQVVPYINRVLAGKLQGVPKVFQLTPGEGCVLVQLRNLPAESLALLPQTKRALDLLSDTERASLLNPRAWLQQIPQPASDTPKPVTEARDEQQARIEKERLRQTNIADRVYVALLDHLANLGTVSPQYQNMSEVIDAISPKCQVPLEAVRSVLLGKRKDLPRQFSFEFHPKKRKMHCDIRLIALRDETRDALPKTRQALAAFPAALLRLLYGNRGVKITLQSPIDAREPRPKTKKAKKAKKAPLLPKAEKRIATKITHRTLATVDPHGRTKEVDVVERKKRVLVLEKE